MAFPRRLEDLPPWATKTLVFFALWALVVANAVKMVVQPFYRLFFAPRVANILRTPDERFSNLQHLGYNFQPNYVSFPAGGTITLPRMHYLDEGPRDADHTILCLHGEPSWSFLYRKMIPVLAAAGYRVIVPDFIGFGKSDKYASADNYTHEMHMTTLRLLLDHLGLDSNLILVCQDWGGLIGLSVVKDMPDAFESLVIMNTGLPDGRPTKAIFNNAIAFLTWRLFAMLCGNRLPVKHLFRYVVGFPEDVAAAYDAPFPDCNHRAGAARWPLMVPLYRDDAVTVHMREARQCLQAWNKQMLLMFSDKDPLTAGFEKQFKQWTPTATSIPCRGGGHFLQETHGKDLAGHILKFLKKEI